MIKQGDFLDCDESLALLSLLGAVSAGVRQEIPVGAVLRDQWGRILAQSGNSPISQNDPLGHAEIIAMRQASQRIANYRLGNTHMTVSLEPCPLCMEALTMARVSEVSYLSDRTTSVTSDSKKLLNVESLKDEQKVPGGGSLKKVSAQILRFFFARRRGI
ncbi:MAG: nucleoside deaminase [Magnetococcales bacterium]|nr:nucleoside deaminase [Magnetococcales bacterium]